MKRNFTKKLVLITLAIAISNPAFAFKKRSYEKAIPSNECEALSEKGDYRNDGKSCIINKDPRVVGACQEGMCKQQRLLRFKFPWK